MWRDAILPKYFEGILSPLFAKNIIKKEFYLEKAIGSTVGDMFGVTLKRNNGLRSFHLHDLYDGSGKEALGRNIDNGNLILVELMNVIDRRTMCPFFISEDGELFCVSPDSYEPHYIRKILSAYNSTVSIYGRPSPTRSNFVPLTHEFGPGFWRTLDNDYHILKNLGAMVVNRATSMGDEGRVFMSEGKDFMHTTRDKIQEWSPLPNYIGEENKKIIFSKSVIRRFGKLRKIPQRYLEGDDSWAPEGKSWHWMPTISDENYEFKK